jgi:hypothetical protein
VHCFTEPYNIGTIVARRRAKKTKKKEASLYADNVATGRGRHSREIKLKKSKCEEGHVALGVK